MDRIRTSADIGQIIRNRRKILGWDQAHLAHQVGVSRQWIVDIEKGKPRAELHLVLRTIHVLGLDLGITPPSDGVPQLPSAQTSAMPIDIDDVIELNRGVPANATSLLHSLSNSTQLQQLKARDALKTYPGLYQIKALDVLKNTGLAGSSKTLDAIKTSNAFELAKLMESPTAKEPKIPASAGSSHLKGMPPKPDTLARTQKTTAKKNKPKGKTK